MTKSSDSSPWVSNKKYKFTNSRIFKKIGLQWTPNTRRLLNVAYWCYSPGIRATILRRGLAPIAGQLGYLR